VRLGQAHRFSPSGIGREEYLPCGAQDDAEVKHGRPVLQVTHVGLEAMGNGIDGAGFATEAADLGEAGDAGFYEGANVEAGHDLGELDIVLNEVRTRPDDAHLAAQDVDELRKFIEGVAAEQMSGREDAGSLRVAGGRVRMHGAEFPDHEFPVLDARANLAKEERPGRLEPMDDPDDGGERRQEKDEDEE